MFTAAYLCSRMPHSGLDMETPFKRLYGNKANLSHFKIIGARAFVHTKDAKKLEPKSWEGMLCGFSEDEAVSYWVWNSKIRRVVESRNVAFIETLDPFNDWGGGWGCNKIVPFLGGDGTKIAPVGDICDQPPGGIS